jgi:hypothetical protein
LFNLTFAQRAALMWAGGLHCSNLPTGAHQESNTELSNDFCEPLASVVSHSRTLREVGRRTEK